MHYQQLIVTEPAANFRALARQGLQGRWGDAFMKGLLYVLVLSLPMNIIVELTGLTQLSQQYASYIAGQITYAELAGQVSTMSGPVGLAYLYELLVAGALTFGITQIYLLYRRRQEAPTDVLFSGFSHYGRAFVLFLLMAIFTFLWTLLFVIPGIIAMYRYRLAFYILVENPDVGPLEAINISKELMRGNKWKLFCLHISFIGWAILAGIAVGLISTPLSLTAAAGIGVEVTVLHAVISSIITAVCCGMLYMYIGTAEAAFYERASGLLKYTDEMGSGAAPGGYRYPE
jgi:uncharacterized membrane protein